MINLKTFNEDVEYAIFDDFKTWDSLQYKQWMGNEREFEATDKYTRKIHVNWGKPIIIIANHTPHFDEMDWVRENAVFYEVKEKLY